MTQTERPSPNHTLFVQVLAQIEREPQKWEQADWGPTAPSCNTAYCFAGWAAVLSGASRQFEEDGDENIFVRFGDRTELVHHAACRLLGIPLHSNRWTQDSDLSLFSGYNQKDDLYRISAEYLGIDETVLRDKVAAEVQA